MKVIIIGGVAGGASAAARLRRLLRTEIRNKSILPSFTFKDDSQRSSAPISYIYDKLIRRFGHERARQYAHANQRAIDRFWEMAAEIGAQCAMQEMDALSLIHI